MYRILDLKIVFKICLSSRRAKTKIQQRTPVPTSSLHARTHFPGPTHVHHQRQTLNQKTLNPDLLYLPFHNPRSDFGLHDRQRVSNLQQRCNFRAVVVEEEEEDKKTKEKEKERGDEMSGRWYLKLVLVGAAVGASMELFMISTGFCTFSFHDLLLLLLPLSLVIVWWSFKQMFFSRFLFSHEGGFFGCWISWCGLQFLCLEGKLFTLQIRWVGHEAIAVAYMSLAVVGK